MINQTLTAASVLLLCVAGSAITPPQSLEQETSRQKIEQKISRGAGCTAYNGCEEPDWSYLDLHS